MASRSVHIVTLGCARNETDSEQLAGLLQADGLSLVDAPAQADVVLVNTCGFIEAAKKDSIDTLLGLADLRSSNPAAKVVAVGCLAQRYQSELASALPEVDAVLGFADYPLIGPRLRAVLDGQPEVATQPVALATTSPQRVRLDNGPTAPLKIASGCDRRCAFCAIPGIRGSFSSRPADEIIAEARWLVDNGVKEVMLVAEDTTAYGKDRHDRDALPNLLARLGKVDGLAWVRLSYLQPAEVTPRLLDAMADVGNVVPYFDLSFQHASASVLRRMRRFGDASSFLDLLAQVRSRCPQSGVRTSAIVGFPGETEDDLTILHDFLSAARPDAIGLFAYSDEEGTLAYGMDQHIPQDIVATRLGETADLANWVMDSRAAERVGEQVDVLVESVGKTILGRSAHQGPEVDGSTTLDWPAEATLPSIGDIVAARVVASDGVDLVGKPV